VSTIVLNPFLLLKTDSARAPGQFLVKFFTVKLRPARVSLRAFHRSIFITSPTNTQIHKAGKSPLPGGR